MFWRLFSTYLLLVLIAVGLVGLLIFQRDPPLFFDLAKEVGLAVLFAVGVSVGLAYLLARRFARPLNVLTDGARRLTDGDLGHTIRVSGSTEHTALAATFNAMSSRLAATFAQTAHDHEQLRTILSGMVEGVIAVDHDQKVLFANERAGVLLEFDPLTAVDRKLWEVARQRGFLEILEKGLGNAGPYREELDLKGPNERSLAVYVSRLPGQSSPGAVVVIHDNTGLRKLERMRQDFVANVSHELKTPLAVIKSNVEALQDGAADDPETRALFLGQASQEADRLEALIQDLLSLAFLFSVLRMAAPLILTALGGLISERSGIVNIALEGHMLIGAFVGASVAHATGSPWLAWFPSPLLKSNTGQNITAPTVVLIVSS